MRLGDTVAIAPGENAQGEWFGEVLELFQDSAVPLPPPPPPPPASGTPATSLDRFEMELAVTGRCVCIPNIARGIVHVVQAGA